MSLHMNDLASFAVFATFVAGLIGTLATFAGRYVILPKLNAHTEAKLEPIIATIDFIKKQVGENHHSNESPTVLDKVDDVAQSVDQLKSVMVDHLKVADGDRVVMARVVADVDALKKAAS